MRWRNDTKMPRRDEDILAELGRTLSAGQEGRMEHLLMEYADLTDRIASLKMRQRTWQAKVMRDRRAVVAQKIAQLRAQEGSHDGD